MAVDEREMELERGRRVESDGRRDVEELNAGDLTLLSVLIVVLIPFTAAVDGPAMADVDDATVGIRGAPRFFLGMKRFKEDAMMGKSTVTLCDIRRSWV